MPVVESLKRGTSSWDFLFLSYPVRALADVTHVFAYLLALPIGITSKVDFQSYLSFDDVQHLAIKVGKGLKGRKSFHASFTKSRSVWLKNPNSKLLGSLSGYLLALLERWIYNLT